MLKCSWYKGESQDIQLYMRGCPPTWATIKTLPTTLCSSTFSCSSHLSPARSCCHTWPSGWNRCFFFIVYIYLLGLPRWLSGKESACQCRRLQEMEVQCLGQEEPLKKWQPTPVFLPGKFHGSRSLVSYSSWGCKQSDMTEWALWSYLSLLLNFSQLPTSYSNLYPQPRHFLWTPDPKDCSLPGSSVHGISQVRILE